MGEELVLLGAPQIYLFNRFKIPRSTDSVNIIILFIPVSERVPRVML